MGADFIASALWRRGDSLTLTEAEFAGIRERIGLLAPLDLQSRLQDFWEMLESGDVEGVSDEDRDDPAKFGEAIAEAIRLTLLGDVDFLEAAIGGGRRDTGALHIGPYVVLLMGEMSWGDVDEGQESMWRLADSRVLEPLGFQIAGYPTKFGPGGYGTVISTVFEVIADRRECKVEDVVKAADAAELYEDQAWERVLGPAVDYVEDALHEYLPEVPA
jgi:hypothetical protein